MSDLYVKYHYQAVAWCDDSAPALMLNPPAWYVWERGHPVSEPFAERAHAYAEMQSMQARLAADRIAHASEY